MKLLLAIALLFVMGWPSHAQRRHRRSHSQTQHVKMVSEEGVEAPPNVCEDLDKCTSGERIPTNGCKCPTDKQLLTRLRRLHHPKASEIFKAK